VADGRQRDGEGGADEGADAGHDIRGAKRLTLRNENILNY
jgi:hypothetical protein